MLIEIHELFAYNRWANARTIEAVSKLTDEELRRDLGNSFPSVLATLTHMANGDWVWLQRWQGRAATGFPLDAAQLTLPALIDHWRAIEEERTAFINGLSDAALRASFSYKTFAGQPFTQPLYHTLKHIVNHGTYHRGQITTMLRQLGREPVGTDMVVFYREREVYSPEIGN